MFGQKQNTHSISKSNAKLQPQKSHGIFLTGLFLAGFGLLLLFSTGHTIVTNWHRMGHLQQRQYALTVRALCGTLLVGGGFVGMIWGTQGWHALDVRSDSDDETRNGETSMFSQRNSDWEDRLETADRKWIEYSNCCCHNCHAVNDATARFCDQCGQAVRETTNNLVA